MKKTLLGWASTVWGAQEVSREDCSPEKWRGRGGMGEVVRGHLECHSEDSEELGGTEPLKGDLGLRGA